MKKLRLGLAVAYIGWGLVIGWSGTGLLGELRSFAGSAEHVSYGFSLSALVVAWFCFFTMHLLLAYWIVRGRHRRAVLVMAAVSAAGVPVGTILGGVTVWALTRPEIQARFQ